MTDHLSPEDRALIERIDELATVTEEQFVLQGPALCLVRLRRIREEIATARTDTSRTPVAQAVELSAHNGLVPGSSPGGSTEGRESRPSGVRPGDIDWLKRCKDVGHCGEGSMESKARHDHNERIDRLLAALPPSVGAETPAWRPDREAVARIVDHEGYWERLDSCNHALATVKMDAHQRHALTAVRDDEQRGTAESLAKADAILSLVPSQGTGEPVAWTDEQVEAAARAHDEEDAAQKGEPSPWTHFNCSTGAEFEWDCPDCRSFRFERLAAMRKGLEALAAAPAQPQGGADHG